MAAHDDPVGAAGYLAFSVPNLVLAMTNQASTVFDWAQGGSDGHAERVMFSTVYLVRAMYLFVARALHSQQAFPRFQPHRRSTSAGLLSTAPLAAC